MDNCKSEISEVVSNITEESNDLPVDISMVSEVEEGKLKYNYLIMLKYIYKISISCLDLKKDSDYYWT